MSCDHLRAEAVPAEAIVVLRGGPEHRLVTAESRPPDEARDPSVVMPGAIVVAGVLDTPAVAEVVDLITKPAGTVVHLRILPGSISDYAAAVIRATASA